MAYSDEEYEFVSKDSLSSLKNEISKLKEGGMKEVVAKDEDLHKSIKTLNQTLKSLMDVFHDASVEMKLEETESSGLKERLKPIESKIDILIEQNRKIAQGLIAITEAVQTKFDEIETTLGLHAKKLSPDIGTHDYGYDDQMNQMPQNNDHMQFDQMPQNNDHMQPPQMTSLPGMDPPQIPSDFGFEDSNYSSMSAGMSDDNSIPEMPEPPMAPNNRDEQGQKQFNNLFGSYSGQG